jgi:type I restriction enzyme R subunit
MEPEEEARAIIDDLLTQAGWVLQDYTKRNIRASQGVAIREFQLGKDSADYLLVVDGKVVGVIEAKPLGTTLGGVSEQTLKYLKNIPEGIPKFGNIAPFGYESTGKETQFIDLRDPNPRSRRVFAFHQPKTLGDWVSEENTLRYRLQKMPELSPEGLRDCQYKAIINLEKSFAEDRPRALIQMASGSGKTYTAENFWYRLIKFAKARRVLFLVDRRTLGIQAETEFQGFVTPYDRRKITELYNIQRLTSHHIDNTSKLCISTIQRIYAQLMDNEDLTEAGEEASSYESNTSDEPVEVKYNPKIPIEKFDFIITDECHRSIYKKWRQVLEYFDASIIGLTATPSKQTLGFFNQNLVMEYSHERAVADRVNVGYDVYRIKTEITESGSKVEKGFYVDKRDKLTRSVRIEQLDEDLEYDPTQLDRSIVSKDQIRTIIRTFKEVVLTEIFPGRQNVPKTVIFAKDDSHAEDILHIVREEFGKGNEFCKKITYMTTGEDPQQMIKDFPKSFNPRIVVTVDMISTGVDIKPVECLLFMRDVKSQIYFEQMKGRGTRVVSETELQQATPEAKYKDHFVIVDAVGVCESDKTDSRPLEREYGVGFKALLDKFAFGSADEDSIISLAGRLARLDKKFTEEQRQEIRTKTGFSLRELTNRLFDSVNADLRIDKAKKIFGTEEPNEEQLNEASKSLVSEACEPFVSDVVRGVILDVKMRNEQIIDYVSKDSVISAGFDVIAKDRARVNVKAFEDFIEAHKDELAALQFIYSKPYGRRQLTYREIRELTDALIRASPDFTAERLWSAYHQLESSKVRGAGPAKLLTDIVSLVRFAVGNDAVLEPYLDVVNRRFNEWLERQQKAGKQFTNEQTQWLEDIKNHIGASANIEIDDLENVPFNKKGGAVKAYQLFGANLSLTLDELNVVLNNE